MSIHDPRPAQAEPGYRFDTAFRWLKWGGVAGIVVVYLRYAYIYSNPYPWPNGDPYFYTNNNFFFGEHWLVAGVLAALTWVVSIADRWGSTEGEHSWRSFRAAFVASALALLFWGWAAVLVFLAWTNSIR